MNRGSWKTKKRYQQFLDENAPFNADDWIIGGKRRYGSYGYAIRKYDPIAFEVGFNEFIRSWRGN